MFDDLRLGWALWRVWGQLKEGTMDAHAWSQVATLAIPLVNMILVPAILRGLKAWAPRMPSWLVPILAPVIGAVGTGLAAATTGVVDSTAVAIVGGGIGGLAGVGGREVIDQAKKPSRAVGALVLLVALGFATAARAHHTEPVAPPESVTDCYVSCDMVPGLVAHSASYASAPEGPGSRESGLCVTRCNHVGAPFSFKSGFNACDSPCAMADGFSPYSSAEEWSVRLPSGRLQYWCDSDCHYPEEDAGTPAITAGAQWSEVASDAWVQWAPGRRSYRLLYRERGPRP